MRTVPAAPARLGPQPGVVPLRPLEVGAIFSGAVGYIRANPAVTLGVAALVIAISQVFQVIAQLWLGAPPPTSVGPYLHAALTTGAVTGIIMFVATAVLSRAVLGTRTGLGEAWPPLRPGCRGCSD